MRRSRELYMEVSALLCRGIISTVLILWLAPMAHAAEGGRKVVSTSLCGDAYVLALVSPAKIAALSWQADGPLSTAPANMRGRAVARADGETLVRFAGTDLVLGPGDSQRAEVMAKQTHSPAFRLAWANDFAAIEGNLRNLGKFLHRSEQAETAITRLRSRLASLPQPKPARPKLLYLTPTLGTAGKGTWVDAAMQAAGGDNLADDLGVTGWGRVGLEDLIGHKPDLIVLSYFADGPPSVLNFRSHHPFLQQILRTTPSVTVPGRDWVCGGPKLIDASETMAAAIQKLPRRKS